MNRTKLLARFLSRGQTTRALSNQKNSQEISLPVPWGEIRGKWWGPTNIRPILTLHGWQDNCGSFNTLIPLLDKNIPFLTIDLPGHGLSSHLPPGLPYHYTVYLLTVKYIKRHLGWPKLYLMGHSLGAGICTSYTMLFPNEVDFLINFDAIKPFVIDDSFKYISVALDEFVKNNQYKTNGTEPPSYPLEEIKRRMTEVLSGSINANVVHHLIERGALPSKTDPGKYYFSRDVTLRTHDIIQTVQKVLVDGAPNIKCPFFVGKANNAEYYEKKEYFYEFLQIVKQTSVDLDFHYVKGTHHLHLNNPQDELAQLVSRFLQKHFKDEKFVAGNDIFLDKSIETLSNIN